ncbi:MAG: phosphatase PAP2 family protein [Candidatus Hydrogenedentes bacterium]|nr:phosphatase PAP2 family protein [Candidatus Hydrogenedentota bacterium]
MNQRLALNLALRLTALAAGLAAIIGITYAAGIWLVPYTDAFDKWLLGWINPDSYVPGLDQFMRAATDYSNFLISLPLISWMICYGLYRLIRRRGKMILAGILFTETIALGILAAVGYIWPNKTYMGANVLLVIGIFVAFGGAAWLFYKMDDEAMRRFSLVFWLVLASVLTTTFAATNPIKDAVARPRPFNEANKPWNETVRNIPDELLRGANSFPSGHTSGTFALLTPLFWFARSRKVRGGLFAWACLQGLTRVYTGAHFPFCVFMGGFLGFGIGTLFFFTLGGTRLVAVPVDVDPAEETRPEDDPAGDMGRQVLRPTG